MPKLMFVVTEDWYFISHRLALALEAKRTGFEVIVVTRFGCHRNVIEEAGLDTVPFEMKRSGLNPFALMIEAFGLSRVIRHEQPDILHLVALRPVVVGALASRLAGITKVVSAVTGLGFIFTDGRRLTLIRQVFQRVLPWLLSRGLTIVQNHDDAKQLSAFGLRPDHLRLIPGAGIDTKHYIPGDTLKGTAVVMMASRLLWDKGVGEFVEAARLLSGHDARFVLVGAVDEDNPASISDRELNSWMTEGVVEWWGYSEDMASTLLKSDIFCLPSYREGMPKVVLEAMACGKACVTTNVPGCREVVRHEDNGLLVPARNAAALASAIARLLNDPAERHKMGLRGRERAVQEYNQEQVIEQTLAVYREIL